MKLDLPWDKKEPKKKAPAQPVSDEALFDKPYLTYDEAARYITLKWRPITRRTLERWKRIGRLEGLKPNGHHVAFEKSAIDRMLRGLGKRAKR